jgi:hypothetical protein
MIASNLTMMVPPDAEESRWRLVRKGSSGKSGHHIDFRFFVQSGELCGALVCAGEGNMEIPLSDIYFDGSELSFRMQVFSDAKSKAVIASPNTISLKVIDGDSLEGQHINPRGTPCSDVWLKLVRAK